MNINNTPDNEAAGKLPESPVAKKLSRRGMIRGLAAGTAASLAAVTTAEAAFGNPQTPSVMTVRLSASTARRGAVITATAKVTRIDTNGPVPHVPVHLWFGSPTYPSSRIGTSIYTNANGEAVLRFTVSQWSSLGRNVVVGDFPGNGYHSYAIGFANLQVTA